MKTSAYLKVSFFILSLAVVIPVGATKLRLDSMVVHGPDTNDSTGIIGIDSKFEFEYNSFGQLIHQSMSSTNTDRNVLEPKESVVFVYDSKGRMSSDSSFSWNTDKKQWVLGSYNEYVYDSKGKILEQVEAVVHFTTVFSRTTYTYDEAGNKLNQTHCLLDDENQWINDDKTDYSYNNTGLLASTTNYYWETFDNSWMFYSKTEPNYDDNGRDTLTRSYQWNASLNKWMDVGKMENTYDATGRNTKKVVWELVHGTLPLIKDSKVEYLFDSKGNLLREDNYSWEEDSLRWLGGMSTNYEYDSTIGIEEIISPFQLDDFPMYSKLTRGAISYWIDVLQNWYPLANFSFYYSSMEVMSQPKAEFTKPSWSFNSKNNLLSLDATKSPSTLYLFNLQGQKVLSLRRLNDSNISLQKLKKGLYLLDLESNGVWERGKLVVE